MHPRWWGTSSINSCFKGQYFQISNINLCFQDEFLPAEYLYTPHPVTQYPQWRWDPSYPLTNKIWLTTRRKVHKKLLQFMACFHLLLNHWKSITPLRLRVRDLSDKLVCFQPTPRPTQPGSSVPVWGANSVDNESKRSPKTSKRPSPKPTIWRFV